MSTRQFMKKIFVILSILLLTGCGNNKVEVKEIKENVKEVEVKEEYIDNNPIIVGLYDGMNLVSKYYTDKIINTDIAVFTVYYTNDSVVSSSNVKYTFKKYLENYQNIENYKIGYFIKYSYSGNIFTKTILDPSIMYECPGLFIYLYDEVNQEDGAWYSHVETMEENTILDSIKLFMVDDNIDSNIELTAFTYDSDDFDSNGNYRGISKYSVEIVFN